MLELDEKYKPRLYRCEQCDWVLGIVVRDVDRVRRLNVFRETKDEACAKQYLGFAHGGLLMFGHASYSVIAMDSGTVFCGYCGATREWTASGQAMRDMQARRSARTFGLES